MTDLITWHHDYPGGARQVAMLGAVDVGAVICNDADRAARQAQWIFWLPTSGSSTYSSWKYVKTEEQAKLAVNQAALDWLRLAGLLSLAERDRTDAASLPLFVDHAPQLGA